MRMESFTPSRERASRACHRMDRWPSTSPIAGPTSLLPDSQGGLYFVEQQNLLPGGVVLRYITPDGHLKTIAGNLKGGFSGDGGQAAQAATGMQNRTGLAFDANGNLYVADGFNHRVRVIAPSGIISTFAGNGTATTAGDGGPAQNAGFSIPRGLLFDAHGDLLISDVAANRIREVLVSPPAISVAPNQMSFQAQAGGAQTPPQQLTIDGPVSGVAFSITVSGGASWLVVGTGGNTPRLISVQADPSNLTQGTYQATLTITAPLATPGTSTVQVTFEVGPGTNPALAADRTALSFTFPDQPTTIGTQIVRVSNAGSRIAGVLRERANGDWRQLAERGQSFGKGDAADARDGGRGREPKRAGRGNLHRIGDHRKLDHGNQHRDSGSPNRKHAGSSHPVVAAGAGVPRCGGRRSGSARQFRGKQHRARNDGFQRVHSNAFGRPTMAHGHTNVGRDHQRPAAPEHHGDRGSNRPGAWFLFRAGARGFGRGGQHAANRDHRDASARRGPGPRPRHPAQRAGVHGSGGRSAAGLEESFRL